ncbi:alcohol dehydrogenase, partial [Streptomyces sp. HD]|nr:alcohol dehydrogenase [Streptomyces sp. HD]
MSVRALVVDPSASAAVRLAEVPDPVPGPGQVLVDVSHASLNHGDLNDARSGRVPVGASSDCYDEGGGGGGGGGAGA